MSIRYPLINGLRYDFSSVEIITPLGPIRGVREVSYSDSLQPGEIRGTHAQVIGRTRGKYSAEGSITLYKADFEDLMLKLAPPGSPYGFMEADFQVVVNFSEAWEVPRSNILHGCRITTAETSGSEGEEAIAVTCELHILAIDYTGTGHFAVGTRNFLRPPTETAMKPQKEAIERLEAQHGKLRQFELAGATLVCRAPIGAIYEKFKHQILDDARKMTATNELVAACVVWPEKLHELLQDKPGIVESLAVELVEWAGVTRHVEKKDL